ncbi:MAG: MFS transporter [Anaerolineae bacterium]|nr:MFS transporter [Anaerolineae bacterium]
MRTQSFIVAIRARVAAIPEQLRLFILASFAIGISLSLFDSVFNNFLDARFSLSGFQRSFLEFPRELPGVLAIFISTALWMLCSRRLSAVAMLMMVAGSLLVGYASSSYGVMLIWLFIYSLGNHTYLPLTTTIGMELAHSGQDGRRLGQLNALRNVATIVGSGIVYLGFKFLGMSFRQTFALAAVGFLISAVLLMRMQRGRPRPTGVYLKLHREYSTYYWLSILFGARKQIFITFAPWVLVTVFNQPTQTIATLIAIGGVIGILFQPFLGRAIDRLGERAILAGEAVVLIFVCFGYGFSRHFLPQQAAFLVACACYLLDQMLFSVGMARATYMKKIARNPEDIQASLTLGVTIDHVFSIAIALVGGVIWNSFGYPYVFLMGAVIAAVNFFVALRARVPQGGEPAPATS